MSMQEIYGRLAAVADSLRDQVAGPAGEAGNELQECIGQLAAIGDRLSTVASKATMALDYATSAGAELAAVNEEQSETLLQAGTLVAAIADDMEALAAAATQHADALAPLRQHMQAGVDLVDDVTNRAGNAADMVQNWRVH